MTLEVFLFIKAVTLRCVGRQANYVYDVYYAEGNALEARTLLFSTVSLFLSLRLFYALVLCLSLLFASVSLDLSISFFLISSCKYTPCIYKYNDKVSDFKLIG